MATRGRPRARSARSATDDEPRASRAPRTGAKRTVMYYIRQLPQYVRLLGGLVDRQARLDRRQDARRRRDRVHRDADRSHPGLHSVLRRGRRSVSARARAAAADRERGPTGAARPLDRRSGGSGRPESARRARGGGVLPAEADSAAAASDRTGCRRRRDGCPRWPTVAFGAAPTFRHGDQNSTPIAARDLGHSGSGPSRLQDQRTRPTVARARGFALTFDDVLLVPRHSLTHPKDVSVVVALLARHRAAHSARLGGDGHRDRIGHGDRDGARRRHRRAAQEHVDRPAGRRGRPREAIRERHDPQADHAAPERHGARSDCADAAFPHLRRADRRRGRDASSASSPTAICSSSATSIGRCSEAMTSEA